MGTLPFAGEPFPSGSAQAVAIAPEPQAASVADPGTPDTQNVFLLLVLAVMALPLLLVMTLLATVLTRR